MKKVKYTVLGGNVVKYPFSAPFCPFLPQNPPKKMSQNSWIPYICKRTILVPPKKISKNSWIPYICKGAKKVPTIKNEPK